MHLYINNNKRPNRWPSSVQILKASSLSLILLVILASGSEAIVKQHPQRSDDSVSVQQQAGNGPQQQQQQAHQHSSSSYNNHKSSSLNGVGSSLQPSSSSSQAVGQQNGIQAQPSYSSSISISSPSGSSTSQSMIASPSSSIASSPPSSSSGPSSASSILSSSTSSSSSSSPSSLMSAQNSLSSSSSASQSMGPSQQQQSGYPSYLSSSNGASSGQQKSSYLADSMAAAASNNDQSYQAAANSVNMALANLGMYGSGNSGYNSPQGGSNGNGNNNNNANGPSSSVGSQSLNPLHYFYYPSKQDSSQQQAKAAGSGLDLMSNSASNNNYQSLAFPSYADQLNSALSGLGAASPDVAASSQDASYLPQPALGSNGMGGPDGSSGGQQQGGPGMYGGQQSHSSQMGGHQTSLYNGGLADLGGYASNLNPQVQTGPQSGNPQHGAGSSISFSGPSAGNGPSNDYMNAPVSGHQQQQQQSQQQQQQMPQMSAYQSNLYNQMNDLSTSNFGNNAGGLSSVASYVPPNQPQDHSGNQHDIFGASSQASLLGSNNGQQFNPSASQLSPSIVAPISNQQPINNGQIGSNGASSIFSTSSLFGQQSPSNPSASSLFNNQHFLNSYLSPQQYNSLTGQQAGLDQQMSASGSSPAAAAASTSSSAASSTGSSSKRFGISSFIMPMLALAGLSLLIPTMSNIGTAVGRKKRSISEDRSQQVSSFKSMNGSSQSAKEMSISEYMDKIERYYSIYKNAVENDDCLNRLICEFGDAVKDVTGKSTVVMVIEKLVPTWMTGKVHLFKEAALGNKEGKEKCKKYVCQSKKHQQ